MSGPLPLVLVGAPLAPAADPNGSTVAALGVAVWTTPAHVESLDDYTSIELSLADGTSITVELWIWQQGTEWHLEGTVIIGTPRVISAPVGTFRGKQFVYPRVRAATGSPTTLRAGFTDEPGAQSVTIASLPLPANAATNSQQTDGTQKTQVVDAAGHVHPAGDVAGRPAFTELSDGAAAYTGAKTGQLPAVLGQQTSAASVGVVLASDQGPLTDTTATNTITTTQSVSIPTKGMGSAIIGLAGTWTGPAVFEAERPDGATWDLVSATPVLGVGPSVNTVTGTGDGTTGNGAYRVHLPQGCQAVRVRGNTLSAGTLTVYLEASVSPSSMLAFVVGQYEATPTVVIDGQRKGIAIDSTGNTQTRAVDAIGGENNALGFVGANPVLLATSTNAPTSGTNFGIATKAFVKASAGNVLAMSSYNKNAAARYAGVHNKATAPAGGDAFSWSFYMPPTTGLLLVGSGFFVGSGGALATGVGWSIGTTDATFTDSATAADHNMNMMVK